MTKPELPNLPPEILESLPPVVQNYIREIQAVMAAQQHIIETQLPLLQNQIAAQQYVIETQLPLLQKQVAAQVPQLLAQVEQIPQQVAQITQLQAQVTELQRRLDQNSQNSSKPPSADPPWTRPPKTPKAASGKKQGGQPGHERHSRELIPTSEADHVQEWWPLLCEKCKGPLRSSDQIGTAQRHQVWEIERRPAQVTEHQFFGCECSGCGHLTQHPHPQAVPLGNFGPVLIATVATLHGRYRITTREVSEIASDLWQVELSLGAVADACHKASLALEPSYTQAQTLAQNSRQANVDETSWNTEGARGWLWVAACSMVVVFMVAARRSRDSFHALLGSTYQGIVNSDRYNAYYGLEASQHQLCWAHLIRNLKGIAARAGPCEVWAKQCLEITKSLFEVWSTFQLVPETEATRAALVEQVEPIRAAFKAQLKAGLDHSEAKVVTFSREVSKLEARLWVFVNVPGIEPTNNAAERALRPAVIWRKTSFGTQSENGQRFVERMLTVEATCQLQGRNFLDFLAASLAATWYKQPMPTLC
jgi:transposase